VAPRGRYAIAVLLSLMNAFVHSRDGYTAVVPTGLMLSGLVIVVLLLTACVGRALLQIATVLEDNHDAGCQNCAFGKVAASGTSSCRRRRLGTRLAVMTMGGDPKIQIGANRCCPRCSSIVIPPIRIAKVVRVAKGNSHGARGIAGPCIGHGC